MVVVLRERAAKAMAVWLLFWWNMLLKRRQFRRCKQMHYYRDCRLAIPFFKMEDLYEKRRVR